MCERSHALVNCGKLLGLPVNAPIGQVAKLRVCFNCLKPGHRNKDCKLGPCETILHINRNITERVEEAPMTSQDSNEQLTKTTLIK